MSNVSSMDINSGIVCLMVFLSNSLPFTERTPVPPLPGPGPSYLKSKTMVCWPCSSARPHAVPAEAAAKGHDHTLRAALGDGDLGCDGVIPVEDGRCISCWYADS